MRNYFISTIRHLQRYRLFTALNIFGLAIGISACWVIFRIVNHEFSYEKYLPNKDKIYRVVSGFIFDEKESYNGGVSAPLYESVREQVPGIELAVQLNQQRFLSVEVKDPSGDPVNFDDPEGMAATDTFYFNMVNYDWVIGNKNAAFSDPFNVVLTESRANEYFPNKTPEEVYDQTIVYYGFRDTITRVVKGIVKDLVYPTEFSSREFYPLQNTAYELSDWTNTNGSDKLYLQLEAQTDPDIVIKDIDAILSQKTDEWRNQTSNQFKFKRWLEIIPLAESHFSTYIHENVRKASKPLLFGLIGIAFFLLILACINYINMSIASIPQRAKEIGVRKTLGSKKSQLIWQFLSETMTTTILAGVFSLGFSYLGFEYLKGIIPEGIAPFGNTAQFVVFILLLGVCVTAIAGLYPGWLITKVKTINVFKNTSLKKNVTGFSLQKSLIVFQFIIALIFISSALIVGKQLRYSIRADMGFDKEAVLLVEIPWKLSRDKKYDDKQFPLYQELKSIPGISKISLGSPPLDNGYSSSQYEYKEEGKEPVRRQVFRKWVDTSYMDVYDMKLLAGRNLNPSDTTNEYVLNETAVKAFGFSNPEEAIGKLIGSSEEKFPVVGVIKDFHAQDFHSEIEPLALESDKSSLNTFNIKLASNSSEWQNTIKNIERKWAEFFPPESFTYQFYDESIEEMYKQEMQMGTLINLATIISILISCLGLFGLAMLTVFQRTKEIGIRKVLGASVSDIISLLSKEYVQLVVLALIISAPIAWYVMQKWLEKFAYRINIEWWIFLIAGMGALIISLLTVSFHAIKAAIANPVNSLRSE